MQSALMDEDMRDLVELRPGSPVVSRLKDLRDKAIIAVKRIRERRKNELRLQPFDFVREQNSQLFQDVSDEGDVIGDLRALRILRKGTTDIFGVDHSVEDMTLNSAARFAACVATNIGEELEEIDRRRMMWLTLLSTLFAAVAAIFAALSAGLQWWLG